MVEVQAPTRISELVEGLPLPPTRRTALRLAQGRRSLGQPYVITIKSMLHIRPHIAVRRVAEPCKNQQERHHRKPRLMAIFKLRFSCPHEKR